MNCCYACDEPDSDKENIGEFDVYSGFFDLLPHRLFDTHKYEDANIRAGSG